MEEIKRVKVSKNVVREDTKAWHWYFRQTAVEFEITGKYLFFSEDKNELENIAVNELESGGFFEAKINTDKEKKGKDYVLCLYYADDSRKFELANKYKNNPKIKYRYWKSDEDTLEGKYSEQFLKDLSSKERKEWTKSKL